MVLNACTMEWTYSCMNAFYIYLGFARARHNMKRVEIKNPLKSTHLFGIISRSNKSYFRQKAFCPRIRIQFNFNSNFFFTLANQRTRPNVMIMIMTLEVEGENVIWSQKRKTDGKKLLEINIACISCLAHARSSVRILYLFPQIIGPAVCTHSRSVSFHMNSIRFEDVLCGSHSICLAPH